MNIVVQLCKLLLFSVLMIQSTSFGDSQEGNKTVLSAELQLASHRKLTRIPFERVGSFVYVRARLNDSDPLWFLLDTGATASYFNADLATARHAGSAPI